MDERATAPAEKQRRRSVLGVEVGVPKDFPGFQVEAMQVAAHTDREDEVVVDHRAGARGVPGSVARPERHRIVELPVSPAGFGVEALDHFAAVHRMDHHQVVAGDHRRGVAAAACHLPDHLRPRNRKRLQ